MQTMAIMDPYAVQTGSEEPLHLLMAPQSHPRTRENPGTALAGGSIPKRVGGGGGKGTWGKPGCELEPPWVDPNDPRYDSDDQGVLMVVEDMHTKTEEAMTKLPKHFFDSFVVSIDQMRVGFERIYDSLPDLAIDVPAAYSILERFVDMSRKASYIDDETVQKLPNKGRKRFVSEGDGGKLKVDIDW